jgi:hypothetical protein
MTDGPIPTPDAAALAGLARWADELAMPGFAFGEWVRGAPGQLPYVELLPDGMRFLRDVGSLGFIVPYDWGAWLQGDGDVYRRDRGRIATAPSGDLVRLLTAIVRSDRFNEGELLAAFESGLLLAIARRARVLAEAPV